MISRVLQLCLVNIVLVLYHPVESSDVVEYTLEHKLHYTAAFTNRGRVRCDASSVKLRCVVENNEDLANEMEGLEDDGLYYLRICKKDSGCFQTFTKQCLLRESGMQEVLELSVSTRQDLIGVSLLTKLSHCNGTAARIQAVIRTRVEVVEAAAPPEPETAYFIKQMEAEKLKKEKGETEDNRSFIAKYWMYIVPILILFLVMDKGEQQ